MASEEISLVTTNGVDHSQQSGSHPHEHRRAREDMVRGEGSSSRVHHPNLPASKMKRAHLNGWGQIESQSSSLKGEVPGTNVCETRDRMR